MIEKEPFQSYHPYILQPQLEVQLHESFVRCPKFQLILADGKRMSLMSSAHGRPWKCGHTMRNRLDLYIFLSPPSGKCVVKGTFY